MLRLSTAVLGFMLAPVPGLAQAPKVKDIPVAPHWIYDDMPAAFAQAKQTGKPILALFR